MIGLLMSLMLYKVWNLICVNDYFIIRIWIYYTII